jgi:hypothetical protein
MKSTRDFVNSSPHFELPGGWSAGYALATGHGPGVVVGPGRDNPNVFAQNFPTHGGEQYRIVAEASTVNGTQAVASVQINWLGHVGNFISASQADFSIGPNPTEFEAYVQAPKHAEEGTLYVIPAQQPVEVAVRYTEMGVSRLDPLPDFVHYRFFGVKGPELVLLLIILLGPTLVLLLFRNSARNIRARLASDSFTRAFAAPQWVHWIFPALAFVLSGFPFLFLGGIYEVNYDSHWHQSAIESVMRWKTPSLDLGGDPLHNFGIEHAINPQLSPTFWIGWQFGSDRRVAVEGAFQAMVFFLLLFRLCRLSGACRNEAAAISLIAVLYVSVPLMTGGIITWNAVLGLLWQEAALATLVAFSCFACIGYSRVSRAGWYASALGHALTILWISLAFPELAAFFVMATFGLCVGALFGSDSRYEIVSKLTASLLVLALLLVLGVHHYIHNLYAYTPQLQFRAIPGADWRSQFERCSLLLLVPPQSARLLYRFFSLAVIGGAFALRFGNRFARRVVFGAIGLEVSLYGLSALTGALRVAPMNFIYVEQMGISVVALLAALGTWSSARIVARLVVSTAYGVGSWRWRSQLRLSAADQRESFIAVFHYGLLFAGLVLLGGALADAKEDYPDTWPPSTASTPSRIEAETLAVEPGEKFKGRGVMLMAMAQPGPIIWPTNVFPVLNSSFRSAFGNDLMIDTEAADIPMINEYGHWLSPPMLALLAAAFYDPQDPIDRAAQVPRRFRANLARLLGVSLAISDQALPDETLLYKGIAIDHPIYIQKIADANLGQFSPTRTVLAKDAHEILDQLQAPGFDGRAVAVVEQPVTTTLVPAERVSVRLMKGPAIHVSADSPGTSLLVLPFDFSYCLRASGAGLDRLIPVNLSQTGLLIHGKASIDVVYRYGLISGTSCRGQDLARIKALDLENAATGRLFRDTRPPA